MTTTLPRRVRLAAAPRLLRRSAPLLLLASLGACCCGVPTDSAPPSTITFTYSGSGPENVIEGTYSAGGDPRPGEDLIGQTYAAGERYGSLGVIQVVSNIRRANDSADFAWVVIPRLAVGSETVDPACDSDICAGVTLSLDVGLEQGSQARYSCSLDAGVIRITSLSASRAQGDFSGTGTCLGSAEGDDMDTFSITGGTFDVKLFETRR